MIKNQLIRLILLIATCIVSSSAFAVTDYTQFGRYLTVTNAPTHHDPLGIHEVIQRQFPREIKTVGQAVAFTLKGTGYQLVPESRSSASVRQLYKHPLPSYLRSVGPAPLESALLSLSGFAYQLVIDPVHRLITYKLRRNYQDL